MKEIGIGLAQFAAIIMIMITLAVSSAALSQWASDQPGASTVAGDNQVGLVASSSSR
jgi:hypothetical protein